MVDKKPEIHEAMQSSNAINLPKRDKAKKSLDDTRHIILDWFSRHGDLWIYTTA